MSYKWFHNMGAIQLSMKLSWHILAPDNKISEAEPDFYVLTAENFGKQQ